MTTQPITVWESGTARRYRVYYFSPVQAAALAIQDMTPKLSSLAQGLTLPATFMLVSD